jgi:ACS family sodium-dependent inorganic phosphate cotransporter
MQNTALVGSGAFLLLLPLAHSAIVAMLLICGASGIISLCLSGFGANPFDVAPRYADVVWGISNTGGTMPGIIGVAVTGWLLDRTGSYSTPFTLTAIVGFVGALFYWRFASGERLVD